MIILFIFIVGLCIGSFLGVVIDRIPQKQSIVVGRSHCDFCRHTLSSLDLIPVFSFVFLKGRCRYCNKKLSLFYPFIELTTGLIAVGLYFFVGQTLAVVGLVAYVLLVGIFLIFFVLASIDVRKGILPNSLILSSLLLVVAFRLLTIQSFFMLYPFIFSAVGAFLFFLFLVVITRGGGMGMGDVKLAFVLGLFLGYPFILICLYLAFLTGAGWAIILIVLRKKKLRGGTIAFGPFLLLGACIAYLAGDSLWAVTLRLLGL